MTDPEEIALAKKLPAGSRRVLMLLTTEPQFPGKGTFNANGAFNLTWIAKKYGGLASSTIINRRAAYRITPLGERIRERLAPAAPKDTPNAE